MIMDLTKFLAIISLYPSAQVLKAVLVPRLLSNFIMLLSFPRISSGLLQ